MFDIIDNTSLNKRLSSLYNNKTKISEKIDDYISSNDKIKVLNKGKDNYLIGLDKGMQIETFNTELDNLCGKDKFLICRMEKMKKNLFLLKIKRYV